MTDNTPTKLRVEIADPCYLCSPIVIEGREFLSYIIICTDCLKSLRNYVAERKEMDEINQSVKVLSDEEIPRIKEEPYYRISETYDFSKEIETQREINKTYSTKEFLRET